MGETDNEFDHEGLQNVRDVLRHALYVKYSCYSRRSCGIVCFGSCSRSVDEAHSFPRASLSSNCCILEQIMSVHKYPCIFWRQIEAIVYVYNATVSDSVILPFCYLLCAIERVRFKIKGS